MGLSSAFSLTAATTVATDAAAVIWAQFVGQSMGNRDGRERGPHAGLDIKTW